MANVTDVFASSVHGTDPQNLIEYITRQRIYDGHFWKQECFGLNAVDVAEKASTNIQCVGGCYGGNRQPTRFLALLLKLLQIQPSEDIVEELIQNEDFGYVRALGAMYLRLTASPPDIYEHLEPLLLDYRRLRVRTINGWDLIPMDEYVQQLLRNDRIFDIALPRLPKRSQLEKAGYLDGLPRTSPMHIHLQQQEQQEQQTAEEKVTDIYKLLQKMALDGNENAKLALETLSWDLEEQQQQQPKNYSNPTQQNKLHKDEDHDRTNHRDNPHQNRYEKNQHRQQHDHDHDDYYDRTTRDNYSFHDDKRTTTKNQNYDKYNPRGNDTRDRGDSKNNYTTEKHNIIDDDKKNETILKDDSHRDHRVKKKKKRKDKKSYGSLFKNETKTEKKETQNQQVKDAKEESNSEDYWNEQRAKLGLKPLRK